MKESLSDNSGFTLIELLIVVAIFAIVMGGVFSMYNTHLKNAYKQDENLDVQQNLRLAMDTISRDLKMAGMLVPITATPLFSSTVSFSNYTSSVTMNVSSPDGVYARIKNAKATGAFANLSTTVDSPQAVDAFIGTNKPTDRIRIISPFNNSLTLKAAYSNYTSILFVSGNRNAPSLLLQRAGGAAFAAGIGLNVGDVVAKGAGTNDYDTIKYSLMAGTGVGGTGNGCPAGQSCLFRSVNGASPGDVVAGCISSLRFSYIFSDNTENRNPNLSYVSSIKSVRVTLKGVPVSAKTASEIALKTRQITSLVMLRNRRTN
jgi:prepilin-type N-terminal cleavage/methylation domain-containing protein